jgi:hypothetical protein
MTKDFWNDRYGAEDFAYGKTANDFLTPQHFLAGSNFVLQRAREETGFS